MTFYNQESVIWPLMMMFVKAYVCVATMATAVNGFKCCGIRSFNPNIWSDVDFAANETFISTDSDSRDDDTVTAIANLVKDNHQNISDAIEPIPVTAIANLTKDTHQDISDAIEPTPAIIELHTTSVIENAPVYSSSSLHPPN
ncbi:hypothetical protein SNE40_014705 [Patella caerulea]